MVGWHHQLNGHELEQTPGDSGGQGNQAGCSPWSRKSQTQRQLSNHHLSCLPDQSLGPRIWSSLKSAPWGGENLGRPGLPTTLSSAWPIPSWLFPPPSRSSEIHPAQMPDGKINWALLGLLSLLPVNNSRKAGFMQQCWLRMETGRRGDVLEKSVSLHGNRRQLGFQDPSLLPAVFLEVALFLELGGWVGGRKMSSPTPVIGQKPLTSI